MGALTRTVLGWALAPLLTRLATLLSALHERTPQKLVSRRAFLRNSVLGGVAIVVLELTGGFIYFFWPNKTGAFGKQIRVPAALLPAKGAEPYVNQAGKFYVINNDEGALAIYWKCVHLGCTVPWNAAANDFACPCHGSVYDRYGIRTAGPAPRPLDLMPMILNDDGSVTVDTAPGELITRSGEDKGIEHMVSYG